MNQGCESERYSDSRSITLHTITHLSCLLSNFFQHLLISCFTSPTSHNCHALQPQFDFIILPYLFLIHLCPSQSPTVVSTILSQRQEQTIQQQRSCCCHHIFAFFAASSSAALLYRLLLSPLLLPSVSMLYLLLLCCLNA